ncbi:hypothetical protein K435DRAFT_654876, partial [Dendrothele bispora CBS 962.96]
SQKYHVRASVATVMIRVCRERDDQEGERMWQYVLRCLGKLKHEGMSDEEDGMVEATVNGQQIVTRVRKVMRLSWRHSSFRDLFEIVDSVRGAEPSIFTQQGRTPLQRVRVDALATPGRDPPKRLPESFFDADYIQEASRFSYQLSDLQISKKPFPILEAVRLPRHDED